VSAITGTMISSISAVDTAISCACCTATSPAGCITTVLQPVSQTVAGTQRGQARRCVR